jgi:transcriptional regulator with XRE-family HTH domain
MKTRDLGIKKMLDALQLNVSDFGRFLGVSGSHASKILKDKRKLGLDNIYLISQLAELIYDTKQNTIFSDRLKKESKAQLKSDLDKRNKELLDIINQQNDKLAEMVKTYSNAEKMYTWYSSMDVKHAKLGASQQDWVLDMKDYWHSIAIANDLNQQYRIKLRIQLAKPEIVMNQKELK